MRVYARGVGERAISRACPSCRTAGLVPFYPLTRVLVPGGRLAPSKSQALRVPRGPLELAHCPACGFITNHRYKRETAPGAGAGTDAPSRSPADARFMRHLGNGLIKRWALHGKTVLDIGCGNGEFLSLLCELGMKEGIGFDPAYQAAAGGDNLAAAKCRFHAEEYGASNWSVKADLICCRHTLDEIEGVGDFLRTLRENIGDRMDTVVYLETMEAGRVFREGAFWSIHHERCSYFTPGSLARLVRKHGFEISELWIDPEGQFVMLTALPATGPTEPGFNVENDRKLIAEFVEWFPGVVEAMADHWRRQIRQFIQAGRTIAAWGAGAKGIAFLNHLDIREEITVVVDVDPARQGQFIPGTGQEVVSPESLQELRPDIVLVMNAAYETEIREELASLGVTAEVLTL